jgi:hypothetical protein
LGQWGRRTVILGAVNKFVVDDFLHSLEYLLFIVARAWVIYFPAQNLIFLLVVED